MNEEEQIILPAGFRRVEYLESSGTQWIETGIKLSNKCRVLLDCVFEDRNFKGIYGYDQSGGRFAIYNNSSLRIDYGGNQMTNLPMTIELGKRYVIDRIGNLTYVNGDLVLTQTEYTFEASGTAKLFWTNFGNMYATNFKVYRFKIYKEDNIVLDFVPSLDNRNTPCMYDLVSQQPFYNQGSGMFLTNKSYEWAYPHLNNSYNLPAGFKKCVYLQSDGTQYIDLDVYPNNETGLLIKAMAMGEANGCPMGSNNTAPYVYPPRKILSSNKQIAYAWNNWYDGSVLLNWDKAGDLEYTSFVNYFNSRMVYFNSEDSDIIKPMNSDILPQLDTKVRLFNWSTESSMLNSPWIGRIYRAQITQGTNLIHDYVPCLDVDNRPCMYDLIEQEVLYNQSGGTEFTYCVEHQLPSDFIKLKYLESTGTQYIKTSYVPTNTTGLYIDAYNTNLITSSAVPMGMRETNGNTYFTSPRTAKNTDAGFGWGAFTSTGGNGDVRYEGTLNWLNDRKAVLSSPAFAQRINTLSTLSFTPLKDIYIFGIHNYDGKYLPGSWRIYRAKISEGDQIVRDFVPAFDQVKLKPCMYDLISNVAFYNDGEGEFLYNNDFEGTYEGFGTFATIGNKLGSYNYEDEEE